MKKIIALLALLPTIAFCQTKTVSTLGLTNKYIVMGNSSSTVGNSPFYLFGHNFVVPAGYSITGTDTTKSQINLKFGGTAGQITISSDGSTLQKGSAVVSPSAGSVVYGLLTSNTSLIQAENGINRFWSDSAIFTLRDNYLQLNMSSKGSGKVLTSDANGVATWETPASGISGLTTNYLTKATSSTTIGNSVISDDGSDITVHGNITMPTANQIITTGNGTTVAYTDIKFNAAGPLHRSYNNDGTIYDYWTLSAGASDRTSYVSNTSPAKSTTLTQTATSYSVQGSSGFPGIQYASDYSANYTSRSLVDKAYVDASSPISGLTTNYFTKAGSSSTIVNSNFKEGTDSLINVTSGSFIDFNDAVGGVTINAAGQGTTFDSYATAPSFNSSAFEVGSPSTSTGAASFYNSTNANYVKLKAGVTPANIAYTLPVTAPVTGQVLSATTPSGGASTMSWINAASGLTGTTGAMVSFSATDTYNSIPAVATGYLFGSQGTSTLPAWLQAAILNTSLTTPLLIGGTGVGSNAEIRATSGVGSSEYIKFTGGSNGATEYGRFINGGALLLGTTTQTAAQYMIELNKSQNDGTTNYVQNSNGGTGAFASQRVSNGTSRMQFMILGTGYTTSGGFVQGGGVLESNSSAGMSLIASNASGLFRFYTSSSSAERMRIESGGNVGIGTTTISAKLHVLSTTEQFRGGYDASNYVSITIGSTGGVTLNAVGSGSAFTFSDKVIHSLPENLKAYTVATLPTGTTGDVAYVTDATLPTYLGTLTGGGAVVVPVFYNGSAWVSH